MFGPDYYDPDVASYIIYNNSVFQTACKPELTYLNDVFNSLTTSIENPETSIVEPVRVDGMSICRAVDQFSTADFKNTPVLRNAKPQDAIVNFLSSR